MKWQTEIIVWDIANGIQKQGNYQNHVMSGIKKRDLMPILETGHVTVMGLQKCDRNSKIEIE